MRWFEVDDPATQEDKRARLERLGVEASCVEFVGIDLAAGGVAARLIDRGWAPDAVSIMLCEGLAVYLSRAALEVLFDDVRSISTVGTRVAISFSPQLSGSGQRDRGDTDAGIYRAGRRPAHGWACSS